MDKVGFIGLGRMGRGMASNLAKKGFELVVYDINPEPVRALEALGARRANGVAGQVIMDMSTVEPKTTDLIAKAAAEKGLSVVDAPVGRLAAHADRGESLFMVGASDADFARVKPMLDAMGTTVHHCGPVGTGIRTKLVNNYLAIILCQLNAEAL